MLHFIYALFFFFSLGFELLILIFSCKSGALPALFKPPRYPFCTLNKRLLAVASQSVAVRIRSIMLQVLAKALERLSHRKKIEYSLILRLIFKKYVPRMKKNQGRERHIQNIAKNYLEIFWWNDFIELEDRSKVILIILSFITFWSLK